MKLDSEPRFNPVIAKAGQPLYKTVQDTLIGAIQTGQYQPGDRLPSTQELSRQLSVSLVTAHRALQELVAGGFLDRSQGRGTFVAERRPHSGVRIDLGVVLQQEVSLSNFYHSQILEGMRRAGQEHNLHLTILHYEDRVRSSSKGYLLINPRPRELEQFKQRLGGQAQVLVIGAQSHLKGVYSIDVNNVAVACQAVEHLHRLGHRRIMYIGGTNEVSNNRDRRKGFDTMCDRLRMPEDDRYTLDAASWRLNDDERMRLNRRLSAAKRPTAIVAGGYYLALDVYAAAATTGLRVPADLSVVGVDDPHSACHLSPPLTTLRQPLIHLGHSAVTMINDTLRSGEPMHNQTLRPELVIRESSSAPASRPVHGH